MWTNMPIYEYRCNKCHRRSSHLLRSFSDTRERLCHHCNSPDLVRLMSTFAFHQSWDSGINIPSYETLGDFDEDDPRSTAEWVKGMRRDMGGEFGNEYDDMIEQMESGEPEGDGGYGDDLDF